MSEKNKAVVKRLFDEVWNGGNLEAIPEIYANDFVAHYRPPIDFGDGLDGLRDVVERARTTFPDYHEEVRQMVAEGDYVAVWCTITGTNEGPLGPFKPTGKKIEIDEMAIFKIRDGKIVEQRGVVDLLPMMRQLGVSSMLTGDGKPPEDRQ